MSYGSRQNRNCNTYGSRHDVGIASLVVESASDRGHDNVVDPDAGDHASSDAGRGELPAPHADEGGESDRERRHRHAGFAKLLDHSLRGAKAARLDDTSMNPADIHDSTERLDEVGEEEVELRGCQRGACEGRTEGADHENVHGLRDDAPLSRGSARIVDVASEVPLRKV